MLLVTNGRLITRDAAQPYFEDGAVAIDGTAIAAVGEAAALKARYPDAEVVDAKGGVIPYGGTLTFVDGATLEIQNAAARGEDAQDVVLVETTGGIVGTPALVGELDPEWHVVFTGTKIKYARRRGTMLIVR